MARTDAAPADDRAWSTALPDWEDRIRKGQSLVPDLPLFERPAAKALALFRRFRMPDMAGKPRLGEVCSDWQFDLVEALFGSFDPVAYRRMINEFFVLIPKKNGKTPTAAAIMLVAMLLNDRPDAEFYLISASHHIANYSFRTAKGIIAADGDLADLFHVQDHLKRITHRETGAQLAIISADGEIVTGSKASGILIDEMHVLGAKPRADEIMIELRGGFAARPEGFLLTITTQSKEEPVGQFKSELQRARRVRAGEEAAPLLPLLYEFPVKMAKAQTWRDPATWSMVNPNLGISVDPDFLREQFRKAEMDGPAELALFASQHLNVEIGMGLHSERWVGADYWPLRAVPDLGLEDLIARSEVAVVGGDIGGADDLFSLTVVGRCRQTKAWLVWSRAWCSPDALERRKEIAPRLRDLEAAGDLVIESDVDEHVRQAAEVCLRLRAAGLLPAKAAVGLDPYGVAALVDALLGAGFDQDQLMGVGQGFRLNGAIKGVERRLMQGTLIHGDQPLMRWAIGNAKAEARGNNVMITKARAGVAKIDPLIALFNAAVLMDMGPVASVTGTMDGFFGSIGAAVA